ncbi:hypothetical protein [uncultured Tateyamaria sp.]|uniref:hypothetical protein n=1 Tax=uncultured Tateyamaria sp. TaxID=455651 RepID=UPI00262DFCF3|nr:hypothetical protein [uncultured Tateyamaria sp.]
MNPIMKICAIIAVATPALADDSSMYENADAFLADMEQMSVRCGTMAEGQIDDEIFGIQFVRDADGRCTMGSGEVDPLVAEFFSENSLSWAGLIDGNSIWVTAR